jgi:hypothetical protein
VLFFFKRLHLERRVADSKENLTIHQRLINNSIVKITGTLRFINNTINVINLCIPGWLRSGMVPLVFRFFSGRVQGNYR